MRNHLSTLVVLLFVLVSLVLFTAPTQAAVESRDLSFSGFTEVSAGWGMKLQITQAQNYSVQVRGETGDLDQLKVEKSGSQLNFTMERGFSFRRRGRIEIAITMPTLNGIDLSGGASGNILMNIGADHFSAGLSGGAELHGELKCGDLDASLSGGSEAGLTGSANNLKLDQSGGAEVNFREMTVQNVRVDMSGGSEAHVNLNGTISGELSGGSEVTYYGKGDVGDTDFSGGSKIRKGQ